MPNNFFQFPDFDDWGKNPVTHLMLVTFIFLLPPFLISSNYINFEYRNIIAIFFAMGFISYAYRYGYSPFDLGIRTDNIYNALWNFIPAMLFVITLLFISYFSGIFHLVQCEISYYFLIFYFFVSAPLQEFCYRSFLLFELKKSKKFSSHSRIVISTILFASLHIMYFHWLMLFLSIGMGLIWGYLYEKTPNLIAASIAHFVVGITAFWLGLAC